MNIKKQLCNVVKNLKLEYGLTYDQMVVLGEGGFHKSQLTSILKRDGSNVSTEVIMDVITALGAEVELLEWYSYLQESGSTVGGEMSMLKQMKFIMLNTIATEHLLVCD